MGLHLARALPYLPANGLQCRRDVLRLGVVALGRPLLHLQLDRAFSEGDMHHHLTAALTAVRYRKPPQVVASGLHARRRSLSLFTRLPGESALKSRFHHLLGFVMPTWK